MAARTDSKTVPPDVKSIKICGGHLLPGCGLNRAPDSRSPRLVSRQFIVYLHVMRLLVGAAALLSVSVIWLTGQAPRFDAGYVGAEACYACHAAISESYATVGMARTFEPVDAVRPIEDWTVNNRYYHPPSDQHFLMTSRDGRYYQKRYQLDPNGNETNALEIEIHYALGSGYKERDYIARLPGGELVQMPVVWYSDEAEWSIAPGYDHADHDGFSRRINYRCVFCHAAYPDLEPGQGRYEAQTAFFGADAARGVDCERCHGPGSLHVDGAATGASTEEIRGSIVNPSRLDRDRQMAVCLQCHLETTSVPLPNSTLKLGNGMFSFRPGERLTDYAAYFDFPKGVGRDDDFNIVHQGYQLVRSACFRNSEMTCVTCHDPHRTPEDPKVYFKARCLECHENETSCSLDADRRAIANGNDCTACHMPQRRTDDIVHVVMTDHYIQRFAPPDPLAPIEEQDYRGYSGDLVFYLPEEDEDLYMGIGLIRGPDTQRGVGLLERAIEREPTTTAEPYFYLGVGYGELGRSQQSIENYRRAIEIDPAYAEAHYNLGLLHLKDRRFGRALELFEEAIRLQPNGADNHVVAGVAYGQLDRPESARAAYLKALELDPFNTVALSNLGTMNLQSGNLEGAASYFRRVLGIRPNHALAQRMLEQLR